MLEFVGFCVLFDTDDAAVGVELASTTLQLARMVADSLHGSTEPRRLKLPPQPDSLSLTLKLGPTIDPCVGEVIDTLHEDGVGVAVGVGVGVPEEATCW
jgi:hypothetical protein